METIFIILGVVLIIWGCNKSAEENKKEIEKVKEKSRLQQKIYDAHLRIMKKYPDGYRYYEYRRNMTPEETIACEAEIIKKQEEIEELREKQIEEEKQFVKRQEKFVEDSIAIAKKQLSCFGRYHYSVSWEKQTLTGKKTTSNLTVWQFFPHSLCLDQNLDYSLCRSEKNNFENLPKIKGKKMAWDDSVYDNINNFLAELANQYSLGVFFNQYRKDWEEDTILYHYNRISRNIPNIQFLKIKYITPPVPFDDIVSRVPSDIKYLVVIDCYTENSDLKDICERILHYSKPCIIYLSLLKCYDKEEMVDIIENEKKKERRNRAVSLCNQYPLTIHNLLGGKNISDITDDDVELLLSRSESDYQKQEQEMKKKEEDRNKAISLCKKYPLAADKLQLLCGYWDYESDNESANFIINYFLSTPESSIQEIEKKSRAELETKLKESVSSWETMSDGLKYSYLFYYFPTTCEFEATEEEWDNRWIVWNFKNTPGKTPDSSHQETLDKVIPMLKKKLVSTFSKRRLKYLTLVCIPASSQVKTQARYEEFSNRLCGELGMINAYPHITVVSEKESKYAGGPSLDLSKLSFDEGFFRDKYVLLFDDVITKGNSMKLFKRKMELLGAKVVGGMSLGKTKHER